ncbi:MAG TPA: VOC family protein [Caulobacteraceae bacterium]|jgi:catechol 2,3-dioxygenase-like lactoylglutathione lyase family enzyme|nr:VOC family protein [Caulobacteraceae bacterium]
MLAQETLVAFLATSDAIRARAFYEGVLGLAFTGDHEYLATFESASARLNLQKLDHVNPPHGTAMGWAVRDLRGTVRALKERGVVFERYDNHDQDGMDIWSPIPGQGVAWFKDPDGNLLSLSGAI